MVQAKCMEYIPGENMSYDEGTARYSGKYSKLKYRQNHCKSYDVIRVYMLNDSTTGMPACMCCMLIYIAYLLC